VSESFVPADLFAVRAALETTLEEERADPAPSEGRTLQQRRIKTMEAMIALFSALLDGDLTDIELWRAEADIAVREEKQEYERLRELCDL